MLGGRGEKGKDEKMEKHYWLHRASYEGGLTILKKDKKLTIGFFDATRSEEMDKAIENKDYDLFCRAYRDVYNGNIERTKNNLWRFLIEMHKDDVVVVPCPWGFYICRVKGDATKCNRKGLDLGWERDVELFTENPKSPRDSYAKAGLLSRMKCRQTTLCIDDLKEDVDLAIKQQTPFDFAGDVAEVILERFKKQGSPEGFESYVASVFEAMGAEVEILPRNYSGKKGDCDVEAVFPFLKLIISVQCKKHDGITDDFAVEQINSYEASERRGNQESGWNYWKWAVTTAEKFSEDAVEKANANNIRLVTGVEFCRMLLNTGLNVK